MLQALYSIVEGLSPKTPSFLKYTFSGGHLKYWVMQSKIEKPLHINDF
jgi:hypothetical protein